MRADVDGGFAADSGRGIGRIIGRLVCDIHARHNVISVECVVNHQAIIVRDVLRRLEICVGIVLGLTRGHKRFTEKRHRVNGRCLENGGRTTNVERVGAGIKTGARIIDTGHRVPISRAVSVERIVFGVYSVGG